MILNKGNFLFVFNYPSNVLISYFIMIFNNCFWVNPFLFFIIINLTWSCNLNINWFLITLRPLLALGPQPGPRPPTLLGGGTFSICALLPNPWGKSLVNLTKFQIFLDCGWPEIWKFLNLRIFDIFSGGCQMCITFHLQ